MMRIGAVEVAMLVVGAMYLVHAVTPPAPVVEKREPMGPLPYHE